MYTKTDIEALLNKAAQQLLDNQPTLFRFTTATRQTEWNIAGHFAVELHAQFPEHDYDMDVIKGGSGDKRPDVIIHKRQTHKHNLLVVEVKRKKADISRDLAKVLTYWFDYPLRYRFGASVVINESERPYIHVLENAAPPNLE